MAVTQLHVQLNGIYPLRSGDLWGPGEWHITVTIDGVQVGDPDLEYVARPQQWILLDDAWSVLVDVSGKGPGDTVEIAVSAVDRDIFSDDDLGSVNVTLKYPFKNELNQPFLSSVVKGWLFMPDRQYFWANVIVQIKQETATTPLPGPSSLYVNRQANGTTTFTTLDGTQVDPRVEICPVVPVPPVAALPPRPPFPAGLAAGKSTPAAAKVPLTAALNLNALPNPAVIPILAATDPDLAKKAARIAVTYIEPGDLNTSHFFWRIKSGPAAFSGASKGVTEVLVYGTGAGATDQECVIELRWDSAAGTLLSTFRAWVGKPREVPYRALLVQPSNNAMKIRSTPADVVKQIATANVLLWHAGLRLVPDTNKSKWDGATGGANGVYEIKLPKAHDGWTIGVNDNTTIQAMRLNFNPGVMHLCYIKSAVDATLCGVASDRPQLTGAAQTLAGSPTPSWVQPSGIPPDGAAGSVTMQTMTKSNRGTGQSDKDYLKTRKLPANSFDQLFGLMMPDYTVPGDPDWGQTIAHELGHVLGLRHRGNAGNKNSGPSNDGINDPNGNGYPWVQNTMTYGTVWAEDLDIIQSVVIRRHPVLK